MGDRFERLLNLLALLRETPRPLTLAEIVTEVPGYPEGAESARRQFERDKAVLRDIGVPVAVEKTPDGEDGYRIPPEEYELPELDLSPEERAALHVAVTALRLREGEGREALWKLGAAPGDDAPTLGALPTSPALPGLLEACRSRTPVSFVHRGVERRADPYALAFRSGNWYLVAHDHARRDLRSFRVDRIQQVTPAGAPGSFERPANFDPDNVLRDEPWRFGDEPPVEARVEVDAVVATWVVGRVGEGAVVERRPDGGAVVRFTVTNREAFRSFVLGLLDHAVVLEPRELRDDLISWLEAIVGERV